MNEVLVIIPTYNEGENIIKIIESIFTIHQDINILIVDDNSPDGTSSKVKELISKYNNKLNLITRESKMGLGTAYLRGFNWAINKDLIILFLWMLIFRITHLIFLGFTKVVLMKKMIFVLVLDI